MMQCKVVHKIPGRYIYELANYRHNFHNLTLEVVVAETTQMALKNGVPSPAPVSTLTYLLYTQ